MWIAKVVNGIECHRRSIRFIDIENVTTNSRVPLLPSNKVHGARHIKGPPSVQFNRNIPLSYRIGCTEYTFSMSCIASI